MSSKAQQAEVQRELINLTQATPNDAARIVKQAKGNINIAVDLYFSDSQAQRNTERALLSQGASLGPQLEAIFDSYWQTQPADDREPDLWEMDATLAWFSDLDVTPEEPVMLAVAHLCGAKDMGKFEKKAWVDGWKTARQDSVDKQRNHIQQLASQLKTDPAYFRKIYSYTFDYARGAENANVRVLPLETAAAHWDLLLPHTPDIMFQPDSLYNHNKDPTRAQQALDKWKDWLASPTGGNSKAISKDVWNQFLDFTLVMDPTFSKHDPENDAWPSLIDSFVESCTQNS